MGPFDIHAFLEIALMSKNIIPALSDKRNGCSCRGLSSHANSRWFISKLRLHTVLGFLPSRMPSRCANNALQVLRQRPSCTHALWSATKTEEVFLSIEGSVVNPGRGTSFYMLYRFVPPVRVTFWCRNSINRVSLSHNNSYLRLTFHVTICVRI